MKSEFDEILFKLVGTVEVKSLIKLVIGGKLFKIVSTFFTFPASV